MCGIRVTFRGKLATKRLRVYYLGFITLTMKNLFGHAASITTS